MKISISNNIALNEKSNSNFFENAKKIFRELKECYKNNIESKKQLEAFERNRFEISKDKHNKSKSLSKIDKYSYTFDGKNYYKYNYHSNIIYTFTY